MDNEILAPSPISENVIKGYGKNKLIPATRMSEPTPAFRDRDEKPLPTPETVPSLQIMVQVMKDFRKESFMNHRKESKACYHVLDPSKLINRNIYVSLLSYFKRKNLSQKTIQFLKYITPNTSLVPHILSFPIKTHHGWNTLELIKGVISERKNLIS